MKRILLVEDDPFIIDIYSSQFRKEGFDVEVANTGKTALEKLKNHQPDLIVLDIILPDANGWELLQTIRNDRQLQQVKVIVVSNLNRKDYTSTIARLGVLQYFLKVENTPQEISGAIKEILN